MPEAILTVLKFCLIALLYLFLARVVRAVERGMAPATEPGRGLLGGRLTRKPKETRRPYHLRVLEPTGGATFPLTEEVTIGRAPGCSVPLADDTFVSQLHARVYVRDGAPFVEDLGSTNGTFLNQSRLSGTMRLSRGDRLQVGRTVFEVAQ